MQVKGQEEEEDEKTLYCVIWCRHSTASSVFLKVLPGEKYEYINIEEKYEAQTERKHDILFQTKEGRIKRS